MYGNPEAYAQKYPHTWEAGEFRLGKYAPLAEWKPGHLDPLWRDTRAQPTPTHSYAQAAAPTGKGKSKRGKNSASAQGVATASGQAFSKPPPPLPQAERRFFSSRTTLAPHPEAKKIMARFPDIAARVLRDANCSLPLSLSCTVNDKGSVTLLINDPHTPASSYAPYFAPLSAALNKSFAVGNAPWIQFKPAPNEVQLAIHSLPLEHLPEEDEGLFTSIHESIRNAKGVSILSARYLNPNPVSRAQKSATSIVVSVCPQDAQHVLPSIRLFSQVRKVERAYSSSKNTQCTNCWKFGHHQQRCPQPYPTCPLCSLAHSKSAHRCPNPTCPKGGNIKPILNCCPSSAACCPNCKEDHSARYRDCPARPVSPTQGEQPHPLERRRMAWTSLKTRLARQSRARQHFAAIPIPRRRKPLYSPALKRQLRRDPAASSKTFPEA
jgi:hypothetical protein